LGFFPLFFFPWVVGPIFLMVLLYPWMMGVPLVVLVMYYVLRGSSHQEATSKREDTGLGIE
jgi:hypothetical protein